MLALLKDRFSIAIQYTIPYINNGVAKDILKASTEKGRIRYLEEQLIQLDSIRFQVKHLDKELKKLQKLDQIDSHIYKISRELKYLKAKYLIE